MELNLIAEVSSQEARGWLQAQSGSGCSGAGAGSSNLSWASAQWWVLVSYLVGESWNLWNGEQLVHRHDGHDPDANFIITVSVKLLAAMRCCRVTPVLQDTNQWGQDRRDGRNLATLLRELSTLPGLRWIRLLYCYPR